MDDMGLLFCNFIAEKEACGLSKKTIENYKESYFRYCKEIGLDISKDLIQKWVQLFLAKGMNHISINHYLNHLRVFVYWLMDNDYIERFEIKSLKNQEPQLKTFTDDELELLLKKPSKECDFVTYRTWTIINFIMGTGARASTIINIKICDVHFVVKEIEYRHLKNKTVAVVPLSGALEIILKQYLNIWEIGNGYLFPDKYGNQLTTNALIHSIRSFCIRRGVKPRGAHSFRHTFAKKYIISGGNAFVLQRLLTHTDLSMTKKYVRLFNSDLQIGFNEVCPLDTFKKEHKIIKKR